MSLEAVWEAQERFNEDIKQREARTREEWVLQYAVGLQEEVAELLRTVDWKFHRLPQHAAESVVPWELADITKYVFSLWQHFGYDSGDMLHWTQSKGEYLQQVHRQEQGVELKQDVLIVDLDGVCADFRSGFRAWLTDIGHPMAKSVDQEFGNIHLDLDWNWPHPDYEKLKHQFEVEGPGYLSLPRYPWAGALNTLRRKMSVLIYTARPKHNRVIGDTWNWLKTVNIGFDELYVASREGRLDRAARLLKAGHRVLLLDDDPTLLLRAKTIDGLRILRAAQPYNAHLTVRYFRPELDSGQFMESIIEMEMER